MHLLAFVSTTVSGLAPTATTGALAPTIKTVDNLRNIVGAGTVRNAANALEGMYVDATHPLSAKVLEAVPEVSAGALKRHPNFFSLRL